MGFSSLALAEKLKGTRITAQPARQSRNNPPGLPRAAMWPRELEEEPLKRGSSFLEPAAWLRQDLDRLFFFWSRRLGSAPSVVLI